MVLPMPADCLISFETSEDHAVSTRLIAPRAAGLSLRVALRYAHMPFSTLLRWAVSHFSTVISLIALTVSLISCVDPCENKVLSELPAPTGNRAAIVFERSCGATTGFSTHVSVVTEFGQLRKSAGNVFAADSDHGAVKEMTVTVRWVASDTILIRYPAQARVFKKEAQANGVGVAYETAP